MLPPIIAYHVVFGAYGFWLPNDPRGSWSEKVWSPRLQRFGPPRPANTSRSLAAKPHDRELRLAAKKELNHPPVQFNTAQMECVAKGLREDVRDYELAVWAAAVMPDHTHVVMARTAHTCETWVGYFKRSASRELRSAGLHPFIDQPLKNGRLPTPWCEGGWKVFLHTPEEILRTIEYIRNNPLKAHMPEQHWDFVTTYRA